MKLKLQMGKTISLGERTFESLRIDVGTEFDVHFEQFDSELEQTRDRLSDALRELEKFMRLTHSDRAMP